MDIKLHLCTGVTVSKTQLCFGSHWTSQSFNHLRKVTSNSPEDFQHHSARFTKDAHRLLNGGAKFWISYTQCNLFLLLSSWYICLQKSLEIIMNNTWKFFTITIIYFMSTIILQLALQTPWLANLSGHVSTHDPVNSRVCFGCKDMPKTVHHFL